jgi:hypothetical protein
MLGSRNGNGNGNGNRTRQYSWTSAKCHAVWTYERLLCRYWEGGLVDGNWRQEWFQPTRLFHCLANYKAELLVTCDLTKRGPKWTPKGNLELFLILASDNNCSRGIKTGPLAHYSRLYSPLLTCFPLWLTLSHFATLLLTLTHPILLIKRPCSPFLTKTDFIQVRI